MIPLRDQIYGKVKLGSYSTRRYPWGSAKGPGGSQNPNGIFSVHYNFFTQANQSVEVLKQNERRRFLQIQNMSAANDIVFAFGQDATSADGVTLTPGQVEIFDVAVPGESLNIFCSAASQRVALIEGF